MVLGASGRDLKGKREAYYQWVFLDVVVFSEFFLQFYFNKSANKQPTRPCLSDRQVKIPFGEEWHGELEAFLTGKNLHLGDEGRWTSCSGKRCLMGGALGCLFWFAVFEGLQMCALLLVLTCSNQTVAQLYIC